MRLMGREGRKEWRPSQVLLFAEGVFAGQKARPDPLLIRIPF